MVQYPIDWHDLLAAINRYHPRWSGKATKNHQLVMASGEFKIKQKKDRKPGEKAPQEIWSEIKPVLMTLQYNKCAYCERQLGGFPLRKLKDLPSRAQEDLNRKTSDKFFTTIEHDVEHFRPKSRVETYPPTRESDARSRLTYSHAVGDACSPGYYDLAYRPRNYLVSCKICNTDLKLDYFPIEGTRSVGTEEPSLCNAELPLLFFPISDLDIDPESIMEFEGVIARPKSGISDANRRRVLFNIDFFRLNIRDDLTYPRAEMIANLYSHLKTARIASDPDDLQLAQAMRVTMTAKWHPHTNCLRSFARLFDNDPDEAQKIAFACQKDYQPKLAKSK